MTTEKFSWLRIAAWSLLLLVCLFFYAQAEAQNVRFDGVVQQRSGLPAPGASIAVLTQTAITAASEATNTVTITSTLNPAQGTTVTIVGMVPSAYNGSYTVLTTSATQFTYTNPTSGLGVGTAFGAVVVTSTTPGSPLASLCSSVTDAICASPNPVTADGLGNYNFYVKPGIYAIQFYGSGLTARVQADQTMPCVPSSSCTVKIFEGVRYADQFTGADIGAKINAGFSDCSNACIVRVPAGSYSYSTTINVPEINGGNVALELDPGAYLTYTGSGDAILVTPANGGVINSNSIRISGGQLIGTSAAATGIHLQATARNTISGIDVTGFSTGAGIFCEGCINNLFLGVQSRLNRVGYKEQPISLFATTYSNNANTWVGGHIFSNTLFGVASYVPTAIGSGGTATTFSGVTIEGNGGSTTLNATAAADNATCALAGMCLSSNTVTVTTTAAHGFVVGQLIDQTATGTCFSGRYTVASTPTSTTYTYPCVSANAHTGAGTIKGYSGNVYLEGGNNESFLGGYMEPAANDGTTKATIYLGNSNFAPANVNIRNIDFQSMGVINTIDNFNGVVSLDGNREGAANTNFFNQEAATGLVNIGYNNVASTNYLAGTAPPVGSIVYNPSTKATTYYGGSQIAASSYLLNGTSTATSPGLWMQANLPTLTGGTSGIQFNNAANNLATFTIDNTGVAAAAVSMGAPKFLTTTNCASSAAPAVCGSAAAGGVVIAGAATTVTVNTSAVTANSEILVSRDDSLSARLSVTCNTQSSLVLGTPRVTARTAGVSFVISIDVGPTTTPMCIDYSIVN